MNERAQILVVAATTRELATAAGWRTLLCGVGPIEAAATTATAIATQKPLAILHVGIAGAERARRLAPASLVVGTESMYCDLSPLFTMAPRRINTSPALLAAARRALPDAVHLAIGTTARVGGGRECQVEAMEGFAVLRAAQLAGVPAIEVRAISNDVEEHDRARWHFDDAFAAITRVTPALVDAIAQQFAHA
jgi:nucleoside phosphorylase